MQVKIVKGFDAYQQRRILLKEDDNVSETVSSVLHDVKTQGDLALKKYTQKFDQVAIESFRVSHEEKQEALIQLNPKLREVLLQAASNIRKFHHRQKTESQLQFSDDGTILGWKVTPIDCVGIYAPGGRAIYPSTVLMNVIPAQVAGVPRIVVVSPPESSGKPHPLVMATSALLGVEEIYAIGGAQAIGALAYGTESIPAVFKIVGPGNAFVTEAKRQVYGTVGIDSLAGPSEILILCGREDIPTEYLVRDMLSQAEHDPQARALLITTSKKQAEVVARRLESLIPTIPRWEIIEESFKNQSAIILVNSMEEAFDAVNHIAPEHLELITEDPFGNLHKVRNAGAIFLGPNTPEPVGDYFAGPNHTLPTSGCAKFSSPLGVHDFVKTSSVLSYSAERLQKESASIIRFAEAEGLFAHAAAIQVRKDQ
ncbi:histidinol dehydrogenase [Deltaproteobacteria bacterium TL4]